MPLVETSLRGAPAMPTSSAAWSTLSGVEADRMQHSGHRLSMLPKWTDMPGHSCKRNLEPLTAAVAREGRPLRGPLRCAGLHGGEHDVPAEADRALRPGQLHQHAARDHRRAAPRPHAQPGGGQGRVLHRAHVHRGRPPLQDRGRASGGVMLSLRCLLGLAGSNSSQHSTPALTPVIGLFPEGNTCSDVSPEAGPA